MCRINSICAFCLCLTIGAPSLLAAGTGDEVVVIYNSKVRESRDVADHYAAIRHVPPAQVTGFALPAGENMTRAEYRDQLQRPLLKFLQEEKLFTFSSSTAQTNTNPLPRGGPGPFGVPPSGGGAGKMDVHPGQILTASKIRYAVLCYGVPLRILDDPQLSGPDSAKLPPELRGRNGAAVDSELATLPLGNSEIPLDGPSANPLFAVTNASLLGPVHGVLMVTRLDGPTAAVARILVDKAVEAETNGLWGRAYFDLRGLTNTDYKKGDDWLRGAAEAARRCGFETVVDDRPETFPAEFPMSQIALYAGWYDSDVSGPFKRPNVEFMPGAFAYHLHSYSAHNLRSTNQNWCGPLVAKGVTATMGCIDEPYLDGTPDIEVFMSRWLLLGFTFGEAACASQRVISWQTTVVGDPLYCPFGGDPQKLHEELRKKASPMIEWSHLRWVNMNLANSAPVAQYVRYLEDEPVTRRSPVLMEKLASLYVQEGKPASAIPLLRLALAVHPTPQTRVRLTMTLGERLTDDGEAADALDLYENFLKKTPDYPAALALWQKMQALAVKTGDSARTGRYAAEIKKLSPHP